MKTVLEKRSEKHKQKARRFVVVDSGTTPSAGEKKKRKETILKIDGSVTEVLRRILAETIERHAEGFHITPGDVYSSVHFFDYDGIHWEVILFPSIIHAPVIARFEINAGIVAGRKTISSGSFNYVHPRHTVKALGSSAVIIAVKIQTFPLGLDNRKLLIATFE